MNELLARKLFDTDTKKLMENHELLNIRNWKIKKIDFPEFIITMIHPVSNREYGFKFICDNYPISMQIVDPETFALLDHSRCPQGGSFLQDHTITHHPFLCTQQLKEYHTHDSHKNEPWCFSETSRLPSVLESVEYHLRRANS